MVLVSNNLFVGADKLFQTLTRTMLDTLTQSKTRLKLLLRFFLNPDSSAYLRGLSQEFGESTNAVRVELNRFEDAGLIRSHKDGNKKMYQVNTHFPMFNELQKIAFKHFGIDQINEQVTENIFRSVNIALVNELKVVYETMDIDVHEVLDAAATKPFGFMKFTPGPGLGGHCIPIDPLIPEVFPTREHEDYTGMKSVDWNKETVSVFDAVLIATNHSAIDYTELAEWIECIIDTRNAMSGMEKKDENHIFKS